MFGRRSDLSGGRDWFLFVDGLLSPVGAKDVDLAAGDEVWWDFRDWGGLTDTWATVGQWPRPFTRPAPAVAADAPLDSALAAAGARLTSDASAAWRVRVGTTSDVAARDDAWRRAVADPGSAGLTVTVRDGHIAAYDGSAGRWQNVAGARALIAAVPTDTYPADGVLVAVVGLDGDAARAAAERLAADPGLVGGMYAAALDGDGGVLRAGGRGGS